MSSANFTGSYMSRSSAATEIGTLLVLAAAAEARTSGDGR